MKRNLNFTLFIILVTYLALVYSHNKYTEEVNTNVLYLKNPLRMAKLNVIWEKARKRLVEPKLKKLLSELKVQDQEELTFKKMKSAGGDKDGLKEAELRRKLLEITKRYALESHEEESSSMKQKIEKSIFKDKKLHKLWLKAEQAGLTEKELKMLREEFQHHQDKIDEYYTLIEQASSSQNDIPNLTNEVHQFENLENVEGSVKDYADNINTIREKHRELKQGYDRLHKKSTSGPESKEFLEPKVASLWKLATRADFNEEELESLYTELKHYEGRLMKLNYLGNEIKKTNLGKLEDELLNEDFSDDDKEKILSNRDTEGKKILEERLEKQKRKTKKLHDELEMRILARHSEL